MKGKDETQSEFQKFDETLRKMIAVPREELGKRDDVEAQASKEKAGDFLARLPRPCRRVGPCLGSPCSIGLPVNSANVMRLPTMLRTAASKRSASLSGLSRVARLL